MSRRSAAGAKADRRIAWWLVWAYPPRFRRDVGLGLVDAIEDRMRARREAGASALGARVPAILDTMRNAPAEWVNTLMQVRNGLQTVPSKRTTMDKLQQDIRYALRLWRRRPGFAFIALLTLALGVGANTAMFSIVNAVLLRPLPYAHADRLVAVWGRQPGNPRSLVAYPEYDALRAQNHTFDALCLFLGQSVNLTGV
ncbi:MAG TPA: ABC transporter permease, partial [Vicinamibacterales bacterium]